MTISDAYERGRTFERFLDEVEANREMWLAMARRIAPHEESVARIAALDGEWRLLVLADDWCGDAVNILPVIAGLAEAAPNLDLRVLGREEVPGIMDRHLTRGARSIPVAVLLDGQGVERGWWGPRPRELQEWFEVTGRALDKDVRYAALRRWYARDRGVSISREIADLVRCGARPDAEHYQGTRPCNEVRVA